MLLTGCATAPKNTLPVTADRFPADAVITQRGVLTVLGRQFTLNGYLITSATGGKRLVITENFGGVLADVLVKPDGTVHVMRASRALKEKWIRRYIAADLECIFGSAPRETCPGQQLSPTHFRIERRWYQLDLQIVETKPGPQPADAFDESKGSARGPRAESGGPPDSTPTAPFFAALARESPEFAVQKSVWSPLDSAGRRIPHAGGVCSPTSAFE